jgi:hypothetical protein
LTGAQTLDVQALVDDQLAARELDGLVGQAGAKLMVSPGLAAAISARSEPVPLSSWLVPVSVLGTSRPSSASS